MDIQTQVNSTFLLLSTTRKNNFMFSSVLSLNGMALTGFIYNNQRTISEPQLVVPSWSLDFNGVCR